MKRLHILIGLILLGTALTQAANTVEGLTTCYQTNPLGIEERPDFGWRMGGTHSKNARQTAYRIFVATSPTALREGHYLYDSGRQPSAISTCIPYDGPRLKPATRYWWQVTVWDGRGHEIRSTEEAWFETALMDAGWDGAQWIGSRQPTLSKYQGMANLDVDFEIHDGSAVASFVLGKQNNQTYVQTDLNAIEGTLTVISVRDGRQTVAFSQSVDDILPKAQAHTKHHLTIKMLADDYYRCYRLRYILDGRDISQSQHARNHDDIRLYPYKEELSYNLCRLYAIGYHPKSGQRVTYSNLTVTEPYHKVIQYRDTTACTPTNVCTFVPGADNSAPMLRRIFNISKPVASARLYATARGIYELKMNNRDVSHDFFNPGWTDYRHRILYNTFDVTPLLRQGRNIIGATVGSGWFTGNFAHTPAWSNQYGTDISFLAKLVITYADGTRDVIVTDKQWTCCDQGPVTDNGWFDGEDYDARREFHAWTSPDVSQDTDEQTWGPVRIFKAPDAMLQAYIGQPVRTERVETAQAMTQPLPGHYIYDMGQNMVGVPRIKVRLRRGQQLTLRYAEMLWPEQIPTEPVPPYTVEQYERKRGQMYTDNYRACLSTDHYTGAGREEGEVFEPHFTSHGFRYIEITGLDAPIGKEDVQVLVLNSLPGEQTAHYETSDSLINRLYSNICWGQRGNFLSVPTDCPQRDERLGWTGDAQIFTRTATYNRMTAPFYTRWLYTLRDDQKADGNTPHFAPNIIDITNGAEFSGTNIGWGEVSIITPWQIYQQYGDKTILQESYTSMKRYMTYMEKRSKNNLQPFFGYGDWVALAGTPSDITNSAYYAYDAQIMARTASELGFTSDAAHYDSLTTGIRTAFAQRYLRGDVLIKPAGSPESKDSGIAAFGGGPVTKTDTTLDTQTGYIVPLYMNLFEGETKQKLAEKLVELLRENHFCLNTGFIGTPYLNLVLSDTGHDDTAYRMLKQTAYPSWLYPILQGATTMWERWNSYTLKNGFGPVSMNSFNHYAYGAVEDWMMAYSAGIGRDEDHPGYKHFTLQPRINRCLNYVNARFNSVYGNIASRWELLSPDDGTRYDNIESGYRYSCEVPNNTTATLTLPCAKGKNIRVTEGKKNIIKQTRQDGRTVFELGPGQYNFLAK